MEIYKGQSRYPYPQKPNTRDYTHIINDGNIFFPFLTCSMDQNSRNLKEHLYEVLKLYPDALNTEMENSIWNIAHI
jgi:hypothetical protein